MDTKLKYVKVGRFGEVIIFPSTIEHSEFRNMDVLTAGFCHIDANNEVVKCYGDSHSLNKKSDPMQDTKDATSQCFGVFAMLELEFDENGNLK